MAIVINKADAIITVNGYTGFYDGNTHGATGTAMGLAGADLTGFLNLGATFVDAPGGAAHWVFNGGTNYNDAGGDVAIVINRTTRPNVTGGTFTDNAQPHGASGFAYGIGGMNDVLSPAVTFSYEGAGSTIYGPTASAPSTPGTYLATANFAGNTNYTERFGHGERHDPKRSAAGARTDYCDERRRAAADPASGARPRQQWSDIHDYEWTE